jgi:hypothetical protein
MPSLSRLFSPWTLSVHDATFHDLDVFPSLVFKSQCRLVNAQLFCKKSQHHVFRDLNGDDFAFGADIAAGDQA